MAVAAVHRVGAWPKRLALASSVRRVAGRLAIHDVRRDGEHALRMGRATVGRMLAQLLHEAGDELGGNGIDPVIIVAELRKRVIAVGLVVDHEASFIADDTNLAELDRRKAV